MKPYQDMVGSMNRKVAGSVDMTVDHSAYRTLYDECVALEGRQAKAILDFAGSGHPKALSTLFKALLKLGDEIDDTEKELWSRSVGAGGWGFFDQAPAVRRHGLATRQAGFMAALAQVPGSVPFLVAKGYHVATRADGKRSITRRIMVIDAVGASDDPAARPFLTALLAAAPTYLRIAALEALREDVDAVRPLLKDPSPVVRRAVIAVARQPRWIGPLIDALDGQRDAARGAAVQALGTLTKQPFGNDPALWKAWYERNRTAIDRGEGGGLDADAAKTSGQTSRARFYGIAARSARVVFILDGTTNLLVPADYDVQRTRAYHDWTVGKRGWKKKHETHRAVMVRELRAMLDDFPEQARFGAVMVKESSAVKTLGLLSANRTYRKKVVRFLAKHAARGFRAELANIVTAMDMAGLKPLDVPDCPSPDADTFFLIGAGSAQGGRYMEPRAALAAFERLNRFRRVVVHTVQICNAGPEADRFLKGLAAVSGGRYRNARKPP